MPCCCWPKMRSVVRASGRVWLVGSGFGDIGPLAAKDPARSQGGKSRPKSDARHATCPRPRSCHLFTRSGVLPMPMPMPVSAPRPLLTLPPSSVGGVMAVWYSERFARVVCASSTDIQLVGIAGGNQENGKRSTEDWSEEASHESQDSPPQEIATSPRRVSSAFHAWVLVQLKPTGSPRPNYQGPKYQGPKYQGPNAQGPNAQRPIGLGRTWHEPADRGPTFPGTAFSGRPRVPRLGRPLRGCARLGEGHSGRRSPEGRRDAGKERHGGA